MVAWFRTHIRLPLLTLTVLGMSLVHVPRAHAFLMYLEGGGGVSLWFNPQPTFPTFSQFSSNIAPSWNGGLHFTFGDGTFPIGFHIGGKFRSSVGNIVRANGFTSYQLATVYPEIKIQFSLITLALGFSPWVWTREAPNWGLDSLQPSGKFSYIAELGFIYPWTTSFSIGATLTSQWVGGPGFFTGPFGPMPAVDLQVVMRFYFWKQKIGAGTAGRSADAVTPNEFKGWRYPFGWSK